MLKGLSEFVLPGEYLARDLGVLGLVLHPCRREIGQMPAYLSRAGTKISRPPDIQWTDCGSFANYDARTEHWDAFC